jgi:two-component system uhpT operon response regulator UhpA
MIQIGLVDDHLAVVEGFKRLIEINEEFNVAHIFSSYDGALYSAELDTLNVLIVDIALEDQSGIALIKEVKQRYPNLHCVTLSMYDKEPYISEAIKAGAYAYVSKRAGAEDIEAAIYSAFNEEFYLSPDVKANYQCTSNSAAEKELSERELEILKLLAQGYETKEVAYKLNIADKTAHAHKANIYLKLGLRTRKQVMQYALVHHHIHLNDILQQ